MTTSIPRTAERAFPRAFAKTATAGGRWVALCGGKGQAPPGADREQSTEDSERPFGLDCTNQFARIGAKLTVKSLGLENVLEQKKELALPYK